ncbi:MAG: glycosyltransferase [Clostridia bacterium]|nr:glycosyltransferase [Clostridia bacterium]
MTDEHLRPIAPSLMHYQKQYFEHFDYRSILMQNVVTGGAMMINRALADLEHTIRSILDQTFQDFELICLDDGSTDNTLSVLREYEKHYNNICVVANSNHGQGWERNYGMRIARGKYVYYMDSDDVMGHNCLERIYSCAEINRLDMLFFEGTTFFDSPELEDRFSQYKTAYDRKEAFPLVYTGEELYIKFRKSGGTIVSPCMQLARRQFLQEYRVTFPEISMLEDNLYTFDSLRYAKRVKCIPDALYNRRIRAGSTMTENRKIEEMRCLSVIIKKCCKQSLSTKRIHLCFMP